MFAPRSRARAAGIVAGYLADNVFGDPHRGHPVAWFGNAATAVERQMLVWLQSFLTSSPARPALYLGFDVLQLGVLLFLTGGLENPFAILMLAPVTVAATILSRRVSVRSRRLRRRGSAAGGVTGLAISAISS